ncbi:MAG: deoxyribodipyrimidine photo-lyase [Elusimicrobia bacterium]|jgi:deoxyribodipyrimidine photo-lyase|nr:deoxyribodipyrimidine photo-lyase [Elusimicrobiota bacterium]
MDPRRARKLNAEPLGPGPVLYWMSRDQRVAGNWALLRAQALALERKTPLAVVFTLAPDFLGAPLRAYDFMLKGLAQVEKRLMAAGISFHILFGPPPETLAAFAQKHKAGAIVTDFDPLRLKSLWKAAVADRIPVAFEEVDAHNIVPAWVASPKQEYGAYTLRPKINKLLSDFLTEFTPLQRHPFPWNGNVLPVNWDQTLLRLKPDPRVPAVSWATPGEAGGAKTLGLFLKNRLGFYNTRRNNPNEEGQSDLSPYLHFGQVSAQKVAWEVRRQAWDTDSGQDFLEELIVRRELSDNYCLYNKQYDAFEGFPQWAQKSLNLHRRDKRAYLYSRDIFEQAETHDPLWNATQREMTKRGKTHGYMRMYWCKKILEWSATPEEAQATAIYLNDRYELDGRDPNGYAGIAWSIGGVHDRAWFNRPVIGQVRWMTANGCKSKFDTEAYQKKVLSLKS